MGEREGRFGLPGPRGVLDQRQDGPVGQGGGLHDGLHRSRRDDVEQAADAGCRGDRCALQPRGGNRGGGSFASDLQIAGERRVPMRVRKPPLVRAQPVHRRHQPGEVPGQPLDGRRGAERKARPREKAQEIAGEGARRFGALVKLDLSITRDRRTAMMAGNGCVEVPTRLKARAKLGRQETIERSSQQRKAELPVGLVCWDTGKVQTRRLSIANALGERLGELARIVQGDEQDQSTPQRIALKLERRGQPFEASGRTIDQSFRTRRNVEHVEGGGVPLRTAVRYRPRLARPAKIVAFTQSSETTLNRNGCARRRSYKCHGTAPQTAPGARHRTCS